MNAPAVDHPGSGFSPTLQLLALCPLLAVSDTVAKALGLSLALALIVPASVLLNRLLRPWLNEDHRLPAALMVLAGMTACVELSFQAWLPGLDESIGIFLPLIVANLVILEHIMGRPPASLRTATALRQALLIAAGMAATLLVLGVAREWLGRGFLLAMLPPGAFISLGLLLALRNGLARRSMTPRTPRRP